MAEINWLGHATWQIKTGETVLLVDPFLDDSPTAPVKADSVAANYVLVSHGHFDHVADAAAIAQRTGAVVVANFEICEWLARQGVAQTQPMNIGGMIDLPCGLVKSTIAHHSSVLPDGANGGSAGGFLVALNEGPKIYLACDTALFLDMQLIGGVGLDLAILPIGDRFTMGPDDAVEATKLLRPKRVTPSHYNTWPPIAQDANAWAAKVKSQTKAEPIVLQPGESLEI